MRILHQAAMAAFSGFFLGTAVVSLVEAIRPIGESALISDERHIVGSIFFLGVSAACFRLSLED